MAVETAPVEIPTDHPPPIVHQKGSWITVAKGKQVMKKYEFEIMELEGKKSVEVPSEIIEKANPLWDDFVIARFLESAPHVAKVHMIVNKIWAYGEINQKLDVYVMDEHTMRIRIPNEKIRKKVVWRGVWNVAGVPMVVSHWSPEEDKSKAGFTPLWVHVTNVPLSMYSWEGLSFITSATGVPDHLHPETIACTNLEIAKVFVLADLTKELPEKINYVIQGIDTKVQFTYPGLPPKCIKCGRWGHFDTFCKQKKLEVDTGKGNMELQGEMLKDLVVQEGSVEIQGEVPTGLEAQVSAKEDEEVDEVTSSEKKEEEKEREDLEKAEVNPWKEVSMERVGRSPKSQPSQEIIATPSRFAALSSANEFGTEIEKDMTVDTEEEEIEAAEDLHQSRIEESVGGELKETRRGRPRQTLPRKSKTDHRVIMGKGSTKNL